MRLKKSILIFTCVLVGLATLGGWLYSRQALFRIRSINVKGVELVLQKKIETQLIDYHGRPLLSVSLAELEANLMRNPEIKAVQILRIWPDNLVIDVQQKTPVALSFEEQKLWLLSDDGSKIIPVQKPLGLPLLLGTDADIEIRQAIMSWFLELKKETSSKSFVHWIDELEWQKRQNLVVRVTSLNLRIDLGSKNWSQRWRRAEQAYVAMRDRGLQAISLDASRDPRVFVYESAELHKSKSGLNLRELVRRTRDVRPEAR